MDTTSERSHRGNHWHPVRVYLSSDENPVEAVTGDSTVLVEDTAMTSLGVRDIADGGGIELEHENKEYVRRSSGFRRREPRSTGFCTMM